MHHFADSGPYAYNSLKTPHLWMGQTIPRLSAFSPEQFAQLAATRAKQKFNHFRVTLLEPEVAKAFKGPEDFDPSIFREIDQKLFAANKAGIAIDLSLAGPDNLFAKLFPEPAQRRRFVQYAVARYGGLNMTWQGVDRFETYAEGRDLMKDIGGYLPKDLYDAVMATRIDVAGDRLNIPGGGAACPKCGEPQPQVAVGLLKSRRAVGNFSP